MSFDLTTGEKLAIRNGISAVHVLLKLLERETETIRDEAYELTSRKISDGRRAATLRDLVDRRAAAERAGELLRSYADAASTPEFDG